MISPCTHAKKKLHAWCTCPIVITHVIVIWEALLGERIFFIKLFGLVLVTGTRSNIYASMRTLPMKGKPVLKQTTLDMYLSHVITSFFDHPKSPCKKKNMEANLLFAAPHACTSDWLVAKNALHTTMVVKKH